MRISVAMATYNGARHVFEQLESIACQTRLPDELVVTDDGSRDGTVATLKRFARTAPFDVRIIENQKNIGYSDNFLLAASFCTGEWIAFCDQDDVWLPEKLKVLEEHIAQASQHLVLVVHSSRVVDGQLNDTGYLYPHYLQTTLCSGKDLDIWWVAHGMSMLFRATLVKSLAFTYRGFDQRFGENIALPHDFWISRLARTVGEVLLIPNELALYRRHESNVTEFSAAKKEVNITAYERARRRIMVPVEMVAWLDLMSYRFKSQGDALQKCAAKSGSPTWGKEIALVGDYLCDYAKWLEQRKKMYETPNLKLKGQILVRGVSNFREQYVRFGTSGRAAMLAVLRDCVVVAMQSSSIIWHRLIGWALR